MPYKIGSFNMYKFNYISDNETKKNFDLIAKIINTENFDIVAMQEVFSESALKRLMQFLGNNWQYRWEEPISKTKQSAEGYAFIWRKDSKKIELNDKNENTGYSKKNPRILNGYSYNHSRSMIRPPYYASFYTKDCFAEIRLLNAHIYFGNNSAIEQQKRKEEFYLMANNMYERLSQTPNGSNRPIYTVILGDYNMNLRRKWTKSPYIEDEIDIKYKGQDEKLITVQDQLTTLKRAEDENYNENISNGGYSQNYDHCSYGQNRFEGIGITARRIKAVEAYAENDFAKYKREVSDHIPIMVEIDFKHNISQKNYWIPIFSYED